jgi:hypothetical protein
MRWNPSQEEMQDQLFAKEDGFAQSQTKGLITNIECWKERYIYTDLHEIFFVEFPCLLYEWLKRKKTVNISLRVEEPLVWDQTTVNRIKVVDNKWAQEIYFWFN